MSAVASVDPGGWPGLVKTSRSLVVADLVESVRLMQHDEASVIDRWRRFVATVQEKLVGVSGGRLVKSLGDGLLLSFEDVGAASRFALALPQISGPLNRGLPESCWLRLRVGVHVGDVVADALDIYGHDVNVTQRLSTLAQADEVIASAAIVDRLVPGLDAEVEDLGPCYLKHLDAPVHAFRLRQGRQRSRANVAVQAAGLLMPRIAVMPFSGENCSALEAAIGDALADGLISRLCGGGRLRVISRLSTAALRQRGLRLAEIGQLLGASYVLSGSYRLEGGKLSLRAELADARQEDIIATEAWRGELGTLWEADSAPFEELGERIGRAISIGELQRVRSLPMPSLEGFSLLLGASLLMHRSDQQDFEHAGRLLEHLIERYPRAPEPRAWLAKWYVLRVSRGLVEQPETEAAKALQHTRWALDATPDCSMALAAEGFVHCHLRRDLDLADQRLNQALAINPSDPMAWIFRCAVQSFRGNGAQALAAGEQAISLSPLDPVRHYFDALTSTAALAAGDLQRAVELASKALNLNRRHLPTLRTLAIAQAELGDLAAARSTVLRVLEIEPGFTIQHYLERVPRGGEGPRQRYARALQAAGVPAG